MEKIEFAIINWALNKNTDKPTPQTRCAIIICTSMNASIYLVQSSFTVLFQGSILRRVIQPKGPIHSPRRGWRHTRGRCSWRWGGTEREGRWGSAWQRGGTKCEGISLIDSQGSGQKQDLSSKSLEDWTSTSLREY